ncbi:MAG: hypothetical protein A3I89_02235 [Candidatus Harrisonbacteria bacterium RIFCSPLOWO2_02_FULL_41_11]|uniref:HTH luxR-type domain-containing protein n=1 Tax=Candidatus Harrisonbacteria bacterium RIFCSPHIGHO2_02_FULL_42_16 TaxID=1798404 RepID=A0A1G1ZJF3_9BACT|nr:MAG: hypothetical protein A3B92_01845 [Candidatus Harrisonbacteria bacterium RIFCSPHIGHO2_02_FULL_42_16]OGY66610.1 MAG: hypothetical protein A3I89_02235 [Candidatus Harrisonbacteria bacterium RIFCSPLOWO2_02_FULL_41_11]
MKTIPSVNNFKSRKEWETQVWSKLIEGFTEINSAQKMEKSLNLLLTSHEKTQMIKRASAISLLKQGKSYRQIGELLWLSPTTINAIRKSLRLKKGYISDYMHNKKPEKKQKRLTKKELEQLLFTIWVDSLFTLPMPPIRHPKLMRQLGYKPFRPRK